MFSKKVLVITLVSLLAQLIFMNWYRVPAVLQKPLLIVLALGVGILIYVYVTWGLTEEKIVGKIAEKVDDPFWGLHHITDEERKMIETYKEKIQK